MKEKRSEKIETKLTKSEHTKVLEMASENNMTIAEFVRARVLYDHFQKYNTFELRTIKILSSCAAWLQLKVDVLPQEKFDEFTEILKQIRTENEIGEGAVDKNVNKNPQ